MKVTVCFGNIPVVVPCGKGDLSIADLQKRACARYKKIIGKGSDYWVKVLQLAVGGGILDWDDLVQDVIEDKEKLIAVYDEEEPQHVDWDVGSVISSEDKTPQRGTPRNRYNLSNGNHSRYGDQGSVGSSYYSRDNSLEVDVGVETLKSNTHVVVRRESDLSVNDLTTGNSSSSLSQCDEPPLVNGSHHRGRFKQRPPPPQNKPSDGADAKKTVKGRAKDEDSSYFKRDRLRRSMASGLGDSVDSDDDSSDPSAKGNGYGFDSPYGYRPPRSYYSESIGELHQLSFAERLNLPWFYRDSQEMLVVLDGRPLGCQVGPFHDPKSGKLVGLLVTSIEPGSKVDVENLLQSGDVVVEINQRVLFDLDPDVALSVLREAVRFSDLHMRVLPVEERERHVTSPTRTPTRPPAISLTAATPNNAESAASLPSTSVSSNHDSSPPSSPVAKAPLFTRQSYDNISLYTRKIGNQFNIPLKKGVDGLGFSITARDTSTGGDPGPVYIKNILPKGAAISDGRLRAGDRLLKVNGQELVGMTQEQVVKILRAVASGSIVSLTVSRQSETLPRKMEDDPDTDRIISEDNLREYYMFEIALNDTGSAGLGISLKGNQSKKTGKDLGIFVKSVFHGGAAWQDGRLKPNDQLIQVNGRSLTGVTNHEAIDILRTSMSNEGNVRGMIQMVIARRKLSQDGAASSRVSSEASSDLSDSILDQLQNRTASEITQESEYGEAEPRSDTQRDGALESAPLSESSSQGPDSAGPTANTDVIIGEEDWPATPSYDPFQRESAARQSISEKRRDTVQRFFPNGDAPRVQKIKQHNSLDIHPAKLFKSMSLCSIDIDDVTEADHQDGEKSKGKYSHVRTLSSPLHLNKAKLNTTQNNNTSSSGDRPSQARLEVNAFHKSISTESLVATGLVSPAVRQAKSDASGARGRHLDVPDVGPTLGIAKSSSLESLQTAVEACIADEKAKDSPYPRPLPRVVRGRVLNDSFRAALDRSYEMSGDLPGLKRMETDNDVREDDCYQKSAASSSDDGFHGNKSGDKKRQGAKSTKLFGLFKINKTKRSPDVVTSSKSKVSENELHKKRLEARREKDFERMKEENERIQAKAKELRNRQAEEQKRSQTRTSFERPRPPSVPVTAMQRIRNEDPATWHEAVSGRRSVDPSTMLSNPFPHTAPPRPYHEHQPSPPPRTTKQVKRDERRKFSETAAHYSSLPRHSRRESRSTDEETPPRHRSLSRPDAGSAGSGRAIGAKMLNQRPVSKLDNLEFYNRQKPSGSVRKSPDDVRKPETTNSKAFPSSSTPMTQGKGSRGRTLYYDDTKHASFHHREESPEPPPQSFYVVQTRESQSSGSAGTSISVRRGPLSPTSRTPQWSTPTNAHRHSVYTDSPSVVDFRARAHAHPQVRSSSFQAETPTRPRDKQTLPPRPTDRYQDLERSSTDVAELNRQAYHRLLQKRDSGDAQYERIEVSVPYNL